jgi:hypothetical protein
VSSKHTKHIAISFHFAREAIALGQVDVRYVPSARNVADIFTKPLTRQVFKDIVIRWVWPSFYEEKARGSVIF